MPKKHVAIVLSGGGSLGAYMAGALDELLQALRQAAGEYEVDIITGASAGAVTAGLLAHRLRYRAAETSLHDVWVEQIDVVDLLDPSLVEPYPALLSPGHLAGVAGRMLAWPDPGDPGTPAPFCAPTLTVGLTMTNTTALPYISRVEQPAAGRVEEYVQHRNAEQESFYLDATVPPADALWARILLVARASAAVPFGFPLMQLARQTDDPPHTLQYIQKPNFTGPGQFWYYDGGTFNNLPVDLAWYHAGGSGAGLADRRVVVINPWRADATPPDLAPPHPSLAAQVTGLLGAMLNESSALKFGGEVIGRSQAAHGQPDPGARELAGVDPAPVELLGTFVLIQPRAVDPRLRGNHLQAMGAFLDRRFREYDFRRGAADGRRAATELLGIAYDAGRPVGYYDPDADPNLGPDVPAYAALAGIPSTRDPGRSVQAVFEEALDRRIDALVHHWNPPGPDLIPAGIFKHLAHQELPALWPM